MPARYPSRLIATGLVSVVVGCGGGGGGGSSAPPPEPLVYAGNASAAAIAPDNAAPIVGSFFGVGEAAPAVSGAAAVVGGPTSDPTGGVAARSRRLSRIARDAVSGRRSAPRPLEGVQVDNVEPCDSGSIRTVGTLDDVTLTGVLTIEYRDCQLDGETINGQESMRIDSYDLVWDLPDDYTSSFVRITIRGPGRSIDSGGTIRTIVDVEARAEQVTENVVDLDNLSGLMTKTEGLVSSYVYDNFFTPSSVGVTLAGRYFHGLRGFIDVTTATPLAFSSSLQDFPSDGQLRMTGAGGAGIRVSALTSTRLEIALDLDGDSTFELTASLGWSDLIGPVGADLRDEDGDGMHKSWESANTLDDANPSDAGLDSDADGILNLAEYFGGSNPNDPASIPPIPGGTVPGQVIILADTSDLISDPAGGMLYASVAGNPGAVVPIEPLTGTAGTPIPVGIDPARLAISGNGQYLYVGLGGENAFQRIELASQMVDLNVVLAAEASSNPSSLPAGTPLYVEDLEVMPGSPQSVVLSLKNNFSTTPHEAVVVYDGGVQRPVEKPRFPATNVIEFGASAGILYGYNGETTCFEFTTMSVDSTGVSVVDVMPPPGCLGSKLISGFGVDIDFHNGLIYTSSSRVVDPVAKVELGSLSPAASGGRLVAPDAASGRVFTLRKDESGVWSITAHDINTRVALATETIPGVLGNAANLVRWGARGLAFRTSGGQIYLIRSTVLIP